MFEINLLRPPGLQGAVAAVLKPSTSLVDEAIINNLNERKQATSVPPLKVKQSIARRLLRLIILILIGVSGFWGYQAWLQYQAGRRSILSLTPPPPVKAAQVLPGLVKGSSAAVMAAFIDRLPAQATIDFIDAGAGVMIYRIWGWELSQYLHQMNAMVEGRQHDDLLAPGGADAPGYWLGSVTYEADDTLGVLRPVVYSYSGFFDTLQAQIGSTGGIIVEMVPGSNSTGEYVIRGSIAVIKAHLKMLSGRRPQARYHRMSILRQSNQPSESYLLRVLFDLEERESLLLLSLASSGA